MYALFLNLVRSPSLVEQYHGHIPCSLLSALLLEDDQALHLESEPHAPLLPVLNS